MSAATLDLDAYFTRIEWGGATTPTLATLDGLQRAHMAHIPFENLDVLLGRRVRLDLEGVQAKLVAARRGGYCFEHATLFAAVLARLGFAPRCHASRVLLFATRETSPRTHMFITVTLPEGTFVVDPGFGAKAPPFPVPLAENASPMDANATHVLVPDGEDWLLRVKSEGEMIDAWISTLDVENPIDFELANHYTATHPDSAFVQRLMMRALTPEGRITVLDRDVTEWRGDGKRSWQLTDRAALQALLATHFGIDLPEVRGLRVPAIPEWG